MPVRADKPRWTEPCDGTPPAMGIVRRARDRDGTFLRGIRCASVERAATERAARRDERVFDNHTGRAFGGWPNEGPGVGQDVSREHEMSGGPHGPFRTYRVRPTQALVRAGGGFPRAASGLVDTRGSWWDRDQPRPRGQRSPRGARRGGVARGRSWRVAGHWRAARSGECARSRAGARATGSAAGISRRRAP
jgi:hypothetical protein